MTQNTQKTAIVSGGATLIGQKSALALRQDGHQVVIADINEEDGAAFADELGKDALFVKTDVTVDADLDNCIDLAQRRFGGLDCLVNVAVTYLDNGVSSTREEWLAALNANVVGAALFTGKAVPSLQAPGRRLGGVLRQHQRQDRPARAHVVFGLQGGAVRHDPQHGPEFGAHEDPREFGLPRVDLVQCDPRSQRQRPEKSGRRGRAPAPS